jgi:superfamily I DNA/RNA helicase
MSAAVQLTAEQTTASLHFAEVGGPAVLASVAGTGKTETITAVVKNLISRQHVTPTSIGVATFSRPGCENMAARAVKRAIPNGVSWRTLHSMGYGIMGEISHMGRESDTRRDLVLCDPQMSAKKDTAKAWWLRKMRREYLAERMEGQDDDTRKRIGSLKGTIFSEISYASAYLIWPESWTAADGTVFPAYVDWATSREREPVDGFTADIVQGFYELWEAVKLAPESHDFEAPKARGTARPLHPLTKSVKRPARKLVRWVSYDDMLAWPARYILEGRSFMSAFKGTFSHVIVDEAQDNNLAQNVLAEFIVDHTDKGPNLMLVGDDQQSIYAFRGSQPTLLGEFIAKWDARVMYITKNFRCAQIILDAANDTLSHVTERLSPDGLARGRTDEASESGVLTASEYEDVTDEATAVLDGIIEAIEHGVSPDEIAVLYRLNSQSGAIELECIKRGILYRVQGGQFFNRPEIKTIVAFLTLTQDEGDEAAWKRVSASIVRGLGASFISSYPTLREARKVARKRSLRRGWRNALTALLPIIDGAAAVLEKDGLGSAIDHLADGGVRAHYRDDAADEDDETEVDTALSALAECASNIGSVDKLIQFANDQGTGVKSDGRVQLPRVTLSSIHKSKGQEWQYVSAIGWTAGLFPFFKAPADEERRLAYVCKTRARDFLHVSWTATNQHGEYAGPSSAVAEANLEAHAARSGAPVWPGVPSEPEVEDVDMSDMGWGQKMG